MPMVVAGFAFYHHLSVFPHNISRTDAARITKLYLYAPQWVLVTDLFWV